MQIIQYSPALKQEWDTFNLLSKNGNFIFRRDYMEYHADRFVDHSLLIYRKNRLIAILPGNINNQTYYTHQGLTFGGFILSKDTRTTQLLELFDQVRIYLKALGVCLIVYKVIPTVYHQIPAEEDLYMLFRANARLSDCNISSVLDLRNPPPYTTLRKRAILKAKSNNLIVRESDQLDLYFDILEANLMDRYNAKPVHTVEEMRYLKNLFPENIRLFASFQDNEMVAGALLYVNDQVARIQYCVASSHGKQTGALDLVYDTLIHQYFKEKNYLDFGQCTEDHGHYLNEGLIRQKEGFGGRGIVFNTYDITL